MRCRRPAARYAKRHQAEGRRTGAKLRSVRRFGVGVPRSSSSLPRPSTQRLLATRSDSAPGYRTRRRGLSAASEGFGPGPSHRCEGTRQATDNRSSTQLGLGSRIRGYLGELRVEIVKSSKELSSNVRPDAQHAHGLCAILNFGSRNATLQGFSVKRDVLCLQP